MNIKVSKERLFSIFKLVAYGTAVGALLTLLLLFAMVWLRGDAGFDEPNIPIRTVETGMLIFALVFLGLDFYRLAKKVCFPEDKDRGRSLT